MITKQQIAATINKARATLVRIGWCQRAWQVPRVGTGTPCAYCLLAAIAEAADPYAPSPDDNVEADNLHIATLRVLEAALPVEWRFVTVDPKEDRGRQLGALVWNLTHYNDDDKTSKQMVLDLLTRGVTVAMRS